MTGSDAQQARQSPIAAAWGNSTSRTRSSVLAEIRDAPSRAGAGRATKPSCSFCCVGGLTLYVITTPSMLEAQRRAVALTILLCDATCQHFFTDSPTEIAVALCQPNPLPPPEFAVNGKGIRQLHTFGIPAPPAEKVSGSFASSNVCLLDQMTQWTAQPT